MYDEAQLVAAMWEALNAAFFRGELPRPKVIIGPTDDLREMCAYAVYIDFGNKAELHIKRGLTRMPEFVPILLHEMLHAHVPELSHGKAFQRARRRLMRKARMWIPAY